MKPQIELIQHACVLFEFKNTSVLIDPWLTDSFNDGIFYAHPSVQPIDFERLKNISAIHISHLHSDHFCPESLSRFNKKTPILIAQHKKNRLFYDSVQKLGFEHIIEFPSGPDGIIFQDVQLNVFTSQTHYPFDSSLVITANDESYLFDNDARFSEDHYFILGYYFKKFVGLFVGYADINPFPTCYDYSKCKNITTSNLNHEIQTYSQERSLDRIKKICERLQPVWVAPYAAGIRFRHENLIQHNEVFFSLNDFFNLNLKSVHPVYIHPGQKISSNTDLSSLNLIHYLQNQKAVETLPNIDSQTINENFDTHEKNRFEELFFQLIHQEHKKWERPICINIQIQKNNISYHQFCLKYDGQSVFKCEFVIDQVDLEIIYELHLVKQVLLGRWSFPRAHHCYLWKALVYKIIPGQMNVHQWGRN